jgi:hypothetical protein
MENPIDTFKKSESTNNANNPSHYTLMTIGIAVTILGSFLRFAGDWAFIDAISNIIFVIGVIICLKSVINILK